MKSRKLKNRTTRQKLTRARTIVVACMRLAHKRLKPDFIDLIAEHIVRSLPAHLGRRLAKSLDGQAMKAAMDLTKPYLA